MQIELDAGGVLESEKMALTTGEKMAAYIELTKPRITFLIVLTAAAGFCLGARGPLSYVALLHAMVGIALLSSGIATLSLWSETLTL
jgi:protoheme IX farnesyltransferase